LETALDFTGKGVVVTGGTRGLGRAIAEAFLTAGADVVVCGRHEPEPGSLPTSPDGSRSAQFVLADVRDAEQARAMVAEATERLGHLDVLVNNAGGSPYSEAAETPPKFFASIINLNLLAAFYCAQAAYNVMAGQPDGGSIIIISSVSGIRPTPGTAAYGAAKAGLINLTQTLAVEWAPSVRVNCVVAGLLDTGGGVEHYGGEEGFRRVAATVPVGRMGVPSDITGACLFLASPLAAYVSGSALVIHGGGEWPAYLTAVRGPT
jgi:NAD(P)-dependent dehydrogenase (short-subunit alcohol dehydrogenase family)